MSKGIVANSMLNAAAGMLLLVTGFGCSIITARLLGPEANGIIAFSLWFATTGALVAELGTGVLLLRMLPQLKADGFDEKRRLGFAAMLVTPTLISTVILAGLYAAVFITSENLHWASTAPSVAWVTGVLFVVQSIGAFAKNYLIGEQRLTTFFRLTTIASVLQLATVLGGAIFYGVEGALVGYAVSQAVMFAYTLKIVVARRDRCGVPLKMLAASSFILSVDYIIESIFLNRIELLFLQQFRTVEVVGYYAVALSVANLALQLPIQLTGSLLPFYAERRAGSDDGKLPLNVFAGVIRAMAYITLPMAFGLAAISTELVTLVFGQAFAPSGTIVSILSVAAPPFVLLQILTQYLFSIDKTHERLVIGIIGSLTIVVACFIFVPLFGAPGAAIARLAAFTVMCALMIRATGFGHALGELYSILARILISALACAMIAFLVNDSIGGGWLSLAVSVALGALAYFAALIVLRAVPAEDGEVLLRLSERLPARLGRPARSFIRLLAPGAANRCNLTAVVGAGRQAALPVTFSSTIGLFQPEDTSIPSRDHAVLFLSPWGFEEMCVRKFYRLQAEALAEAGLPSLRFDYPGTGDSLDPEPDALTLSLWEQTAIDAAEQLKVLTGRSKLIVIGQGLGASLAQRLAGRIKGVESIAMLAPTTNGRISLREIALWSKMVDVGLGLRDDQRDTSGVTIAGLTMPSAIAADIKAMNIVTEDGPAAPRYLILERAAKIGDRSLADMLEGKGAQVEVETYFGFDELVSNPTIAIMPFRVVSKIAAWATCVSQPLETATRPSLPNEATALRGPGFVETAIRFGAGNHLLGALTLPEGPQTSAPVLILGTAYDRHSGWGRMGTDFARRMARDGIPSFRFDAANVGDSAPNAEAPDQILYSSTQAPDVRAALDLLLKRTDGPAVLVGRCSGGYHAFRAALVDKRLAGIVSINPFVLQWDPSRDISDTLRYQPRSLDDYGHRLARADTFTRLVRGEINIPSAFKNISIAVGRKASQKIAPLIEMLPGHSGYDVHSALDQLQDRNLPVSLIYSEGDVGLEHIFLLFGKSGRKLARWSNIQFCLLPDADHNLTPAAAREAAFSAIVTASKSASG